MLLSDFQARWRRRGEHKPTYVKTDYTRETSPGRQRKRAGAAQGEITRKRQVRRRARAARRIIGWRAWRRRRRYFSVALGVALRRQRQMPHGQPLVHLDLDRRVPGGHRRRGRVLHDPRLVGADVPSLRLAALRAAVVRPVPPSLGGFLLRVVRRLAAGDFSAHIVLRGLAKARARKSAARCCTTPFPNLRAGAFAGVLDCFEESARDRPQRNRG